MDSHARIAYNTSTSVGVSTVNPDPDPLKSLVAEEARLDAVVSNLPEVRLLRGVREAIHNLQVLYAGLGASGGVYAVVAPEESIRHSLERTHPLPKRPLTPRTQRPNSMAGTITRVARQRFAETSLRATSGEILALALAQGIEIQGKKRQSVVASILSHEPEFDNANDSHGSGYGLRVWSAPNGLNGEQVRTVGAIPSHAMVGEVQAADPAEGPAA